MRLIDADKLRFRHTVKCNSNTTRPYTLNCISFDEIQNAPTIKALPIDVLGKIRAEIEQLHHHPKLDFINNDEVVEMALDIIDKYRNEVSK